MFGKVFSLILKWRSEKTLTLGNIYRPPRDLNENYECLNETFANILHEL